jgi:hypothetical protein
MLQTKRGLQHFCCVPASYWNYSAKSYAYSLFTLRGMRAVSETRGWGRGAGDVWLTRFAILTVEVSMRVISFKRS